MKSVFVTAAALLLCGASFAEPVCTLQDVKNEDMPAKKMVDAKLGRAAPAEQVAFYDAFLKTPDQHCAVNLIARMERTYLLSLTDPSDPFFNALDEVITDPSFFALDFARTRNTLLRIASEKADTPDRMKSLGAALLPQTERLKSDAAKEVALFAEILSYADDPAPARALAKHAFSAPDAIAERANFKTRPKADGPQRTAQGVALEAIGRTGDWASVIALSETMAIDETDDGPAWTELVARAVLLEEASSIHPERFELILAYFSQKDARGYIRPEDAEFFFAARLMHLQKTGDAGAADKTLAAAKKRFGKTFDAANVIENTVAEFVSREPDTTIEPVLLTPVMPSWPPEADYVPGGGSKCEVRFNINEKGKTFNINGLCTDPVFKKSAEDAIHRIRFKPALEDGKPRARYNVVQPLDYVVE